MEQLSEWNILTADSASGFESKVLANVGRMVCPLHQLVASKELVIAETSI